MGIIAHLTIGQLLAAAHGRDDPAMQDHLRNCMQCRLATEHAKETDHPTPEDLASFVSKDLAEAEIERVAAHLVMCQFCRAAQRDMTQEPRQSIKGQWRSFVPVFFGTYRLFTMPNGVVGFVSDRNRQKRVAAVRRHFQRRAELLSKIQDQLRELEEVSVALRIPSGLTAPERVESHYWDEIASQQEAAEASLRGTFDRFDVWKNALERVAAEPLAFAEPTLRLHLGTAMRLRMKAVSKPDGFSVTLDAEWTSGTPGRNIEVRVISPEGEALQTRRTDSAGQTELQLERRRYTIEVEHEVHGAAAFVFDLSRLG